MSMFPVKDPATDFARLSKLIYGLPKTGKTTLASHMLNNEGKPPAFIQTEDGGGALRLHAIRVTSWIGFLKLVNEIKGNATAMQADHSCFVLDLVSDLDDMAQRYVCEKNGVASLADLEFGKGFALHKTQFRAAMQDLLGVLPCVFICHSEMQVDMKTKEVRQDPAMSKQCGMYVNGKVDVIMWIQPSGDAGKPQVVIRPTINLNAGSRFPQLVRAFAFDPKAPEKTVHEMSKVFAERLGSTPTVQ